MFSYKLPYSISRYAEFNLQWLSIGLVDSPTCKQPLRAFAVLMLNLNAVAAASSADPTEHITLLEPEDPAIDVSELHKVRQSPDFEVKKY